MGSYRAWNEPTSDVARNDDSRSGGDERIRKTPKGDESGVLLAVLRVHALDHRVDWVAGVHRVFPA